MGTARQRGNAERCTRRVGFFEIFRHHTIHQGEMRQIDQKNVQLDHVAQAAAGGTSHRLQIIEHPPHLSLGITLDQRHGLGIERNLA